MIVLNWLHPLSTSSGKVIRVQERIKNADMGICFFSFILFFSNSLAKNADHLKHSQTNSVLFLTGIFLQSCKKSLTRKLKRTKCKIISLFSFYQDECYSAAMTGWWYHGIMQTNENPRVDS